MELGKRLTDKDKLAIIESIKRELEKAVKQYKKKPNQNMGKPRIQFFKNEFDEMGIAWLKDLYGHFGVKVTFDL